MTGTLGERIFVNPFQLGFIYPQGGIGSLKAMITLAAREEGRKGRILVVDDDEGVRENLAELFETVGLEVRTASNAAEALARLEEKRVDLLLTDFRMPGPNGVELIETCRRTYPGLRAILMTAFGDSFTEIESVRRGAIGYVNKPFEADEIVDLVERILKLGGE